LLACCLDQRIKQSLVLSFLRTLDENPQQFFGAGISHQDATSIAEGFSPIGDRSGENLQTLDGRPGGHLDPLEHLWEARDPPAKFRETNARLLRPVGDRQSCPDPISWLPWLQYGGPGDSMVAVVTVWLPWNQSIN